MLLCRLRMVHFRIAWWFKLQAFSAWHRAERTKWSPRLLRVFRFYWDVYQIYTIWMPSMLGNNNIPMCSSRTNAKLFCIVTKEFNSAVYSLCIICIMPLAKLITVFVLHLFHKKNRSPLTTDSLKQYSVAWKDHKRYITELCSICFVIHMYILVSCIKCVKGSLCRL